MSKYIHLYCDSCWDRKYPGRDAPRVADKLASRCCLCGSSTTSGIYIFDERTFDFCKGNHSEKKSSMGIPYIGFSNTTLDKLPSVKEGDTIKCDRCGEAHVLKAAKGGSLTSLFFYACRGQSYLGAINGRLVAFHRPDLSGSIGECATCGGDEYLQPCPTCGQTANPDEKSISQDTSREAFELASELLRKIADHPEWEKMLGLIVGNLFGHAYGMICRRLGREKAEEWQRKVEIVQKDHISKILRS